MWVRAPIYAARGTHGVGGLGVWVAGNDEVKFCKNLGCGGLGGSEILEASVMTEWGGIWELAVVYISLVGWVFNFGWIYGVWVPDGFFDAVVE